MAHSAPMSEPSTINIGILGAARVAAYAMMAPAREVDGVTVRTVAARDLKRAEAFAAAHGIQHVHSSYDALIGDPAVDLVYIATPPAFHAVNALKALRAGKHVLVEKPFAMDATEAREVLVAAERAGRRVFEAFHYRHHALWHRVVALLRGGAVGRINSLDAAFHAPIAQVAGEFRWDASLGGGALMDLGCYPLQWVRVATGEEPVVESASMRRNNGVDVATEARLSFPGGALAKIACSMDADAFAASLKIVGERGSITIDNPLAPHFGHRLVVDSNGSSVTEKVEGVSTFAAQLQAVAATLRNGVPFPLAADDPVRSMASIDAVRVAASA